MATNEQPHIALVDDDPKIRDLTAKYLSDQELLVKTAANGSELDELLKNNKHRELPQKVFEFGDVVIDHSNHKSLAWVELATKSTFSNAKSTAEIISKRLGIIGDTIDCKDPLFISGRSVQIENEKYLLKYGEIHPRILENLELGYPVIGGEIHW